MPKITFTRNKGWFGRVRKLSIMADGKRLAKISSGETLTIDIPNGTQQVYGKMDWGKTNKLDGQSLGDGDHIDIIGRFTLNPLRNFALIQIPITLKHRVGNVFD
jgi:hypothetical protein